MGPSVSNSLTEVVETDVTLADEDTNSIQTDNANRAIQGNMAMQVTQPGGQFWKQCWNNVEQMQVVAKYATNTSGQICN